MQEPRQLYGLGSFVKKITKPIKKIVKSPIGKAALLGAGAYFAGGGGNPFTAAGRSGFGSNPFGALIKRGLLGTSPSAITNNEEINYFFGNEYLPYNTGRCQSDADGRFKQKGAFFGYARTADAIADGLVPGSVAIGPFYTEGGELDF